MKVKDAMQAFPFIEPADDVAVKTYHSGLSLRDYFAAKAMSGLLERVRTHTLVEPERIAFNAYVVADAMLKARKSK